MNRDQVFLSKFKYIFDRINRELSVNLGSQVYLIMDVGKHALLGEGKRLRPLLFVLSSHLCGYHRADVYRLSTIFEYIHVASLIHDDVLDNAELRRNKPSVRNLWGNLTAVLGGDYLYSKAAGLAIESGKLELVKLLNETAVQMVEGQFLELENTHNWELTREKYMEIIISKTAALMAAACASGAIVAEADRRALDQLSHFGRNLGIAFQLLDDILDYTSREEDFGKPVGKDLREGKITLPLIYTLQGLEEDEKDGLKRLFRENRAGEEDYRKLITRVRKNGVIEKIRSEAREFIETNEKYLEAFPESQTKEYLLELNSYMVERHY
ncbi:MAG: polyprenyl synthetase family protein [Deltaproteobacteria bacterium]|nr:polyprenyl synthetase family protein [Deltaproteobacteria bacterium]